MLTTQQIILMSAGLIGGLALFLYGMNTMSSSLTQFAGGTLETMIEKVTANRYISWLFGTVVTALVQSSSATTVMTVGLAIAQARKAANDVSDSVLESFSAWLDGRYKEAGQDCARTIRYLRQADSYMTEITKKQLLEAESREVGYLQKICGDFGIISNQIVSIIQTGETEDLLCSSTAADLKVYGEAVQETLQIVAEGFKARSRLLAATVQEFREVIVGLSYQINTRQISRIHKGESSSEEGIPFMESCFSFERIMDRCDHIAGNLLAYENISSRPLDPQDQEAREKKHQEFRSLFRDKYSMLKESRG